MVSLPGRSKVWGWELGCIHLLLWGLFHQVPGRGRGTVVDVGDFLVRSAKIESHRLACRRVAEGAAPGGCFMQGTRLHTRGMFHGLVGCRGRAGFLIADQLVVLFVPLPVVAVVFISALYVMFGAPNPSQSVGRFHRGVHWWWYEGRPPGGVVKCT